MIHDGLVIVLAWNTWLLKKSEVMNRRDVYIYRRVCVVCEWERECVCVCLMGMCVCSALYSYVDPKNGTHGIGMCVCERESVCVCASWACVCVVLSIRMLTLKMLPMELLCVCVKERECMCVCLMGMCVCSALYSYVDLENGTHGIGMCVCERECVLCVWETVYDKKEWGYELTWLLHT